MAPLNLAAVLVDLEGASAEPTLAAVALAIGLGEALMAVAALAVATPNDSVAAVSAKVILAAAD
jgi:hypothetical protein